MSDFTKPKKRSLLIQTAVYIFFPSKARTNSTDCVHLSWDHPGASNACYMLHSCVVVKRIPDTFSRENRALFKFDQRRKCRDCLLRALAENSRKSEKLRYKMDTFDVHIRFAYFSSPSAELHAYFSSLEFF